VGCSASRGLWLVEGDDGRSWRGHAAGSSDSTAEMRIHVNALPFNSTTRDAGTRVRHLVLAGELDMAAIPELRLRLAEGAGEFECLVVDMSGLTFLDSTGIHFLLDLQTRADREGWILRVVPGPRQVQRVLEIAGVAETLPWAGSAPIRGRSV
jgi:anti-sigma B factor antagonist